MTQMINFQQRDQLSPDLLAAAVGLEWLADRRQQALKRFQQKPLPSRKLEHWKYNETAFLPATEFVVSTGENSATAKDQGIQFAQVLELELHDGKLITPIEQLDKIEGLLLTRFSQASTEQQQLIHSLLDTQVNDRNLLLDLNQALPQDGLLIQVDDKVQIETIIYLRHFTSSATPDSLTSQISLVQLGQSAGLTLVEEFHSENQTTNQLALQQSMIELGANSEFNHYRLNLEAETARQVSQVHSRLGKDSRLNSFYLGLGSLLNRTDIDVIHQGQNAECNMTGIYLPSNNQAIDYHSNIEHRVPHCNTNEIFRGIIADKASATFNGKIHIFQDAQKSDAQLNNNNLLLTNQAEINTKPELEIYADDVSCAHGATVAQLDNKSVYYLQTRGIDKASAKKMLSIAFIQELLNQIKLTPVRDYLVGILDTHMSTISAQDAEG